MAVIIADLKKRVKFEINNPANLNPTTGPGGVDGFTELLTTWGSLRKKGGNRQLDYGEIVESNQYEMYVYYQVALFNALNDEGVESLRIIIDDNRKFTVAAWEKVEEDRMYLKFTLNESR